jgi:hypothetical protein
MFTISYEKSYEKYLNYDNACSYTRPLVNNNNPKVGSRDNINILVNFHPSIHPFSQSVIHPFIHSVSQSFIHSVSHSFIHSSHSSSSREVVHFLDNNSELFPQSSGSAQEYNDCGTRNNVVVVVAAAGPSCSSDWLMICFSFLPPPRQYVLILVVTWLFDLSLKLFFVCWIVVVVGMHVI